MAMKLSKNRSIESAKRGITPPAFIVSISYFLIQLSRYLRFEIPDELIMSGVSVFYGIGVGILHLIKDEE